MAKGQKEASVITRSMAQVSISPKPDLCEQEAMDVDVSRPTEGEIPGDVKVKEEVERKQEEKEAVEEPGPSSPVSSPPRGKRKSCMSPARSPSKILPSASSSLSSSSTTSSSPASPSSCTNSSSSSSSTLTPSSPLCFSSSSSPPPSSSFPLGLKRSLSENHSESASSRRMALPASSPPKKSSMTPSVARPFPSLSRSTSLSPPNSSSAFRHHAFRTPPRDAHSTFVTPSATDEQPQDLSRPRKVSLASPGYPPELQLDLMSRRRRGPSETARGVKREADDSIAFRSLPAFNSGKIADVLQHQIMVAETVKYPVNYPALIPLSPSVAGLGYNTCSSSLLHAANYSPSHIMDAKASSQLQQPQQQQQQQAAQQQAQQQAQPSQGLQGGQDTPVGLGAPGLSIPSTLELAAQLRKKDIFTQRKQREFIPENKKDESYWDRRRRNNEAAKRSREKRRFNDMILEQRVVELSKENHVLKAQLNAIKDKYGILGETLINMDQVIANMPQTEQILNKRTKFSQALITLGSPPSVTSLLSPSGSCASSPPPPNAHFQDPESPSQYSHYAPPVQMDDHESPYDAPSQQYPPTSASDLYHSQNALNLSARTSTSSSSHSPSSHMDYSPSDVELSRRSPISEAGSSLPHKLRHKSHLGDKDAAQSLLALHGIKTEPHDAHHEAAEDSVGSSDERDSGISYSSSSPCSDYHRTSDTSSSPISNSRTQPSLPMQHYQQQQQHHHHHSHHHHQQHPQQQQSSPPQQQQQQHGDAEDSLEYENTHLRSELERLASEVATLKYMFVRRPRSETDSDGSR